MIPPFLFLAMLFLMCAGIFFAVISLIFLEFSVRTIRAPVWCWVPLEGISRITTSLAAHLIIFYAYSFSIHRKHTCGSQILFSVRIDLWLLITWNIYFSSYLGSSYHRQVPLSSFPEGEDCLSFTFPLWNLSFIESSIKFCTLSKPRLLSLISYVLTNPQNSQGHKIWQIASGQLSLWCWLAFLGSGLFFIWGIQFIWDSFFFSLWWVQRWL